MMLIPSMSNDAYLPMGNGPNGFAWDLTVANECLDIFSRFIEAYFV